MSQDFYQVIIKIHQMSLILSFFLYQRKQETFHKMSQDLGEIVKKLFKHKQKIKQFFF